MWRETTHVTNLNMARTFGFFFHFACIVGLVFSNGEYRERETVSVTASNGMPWPMPQQYSSTSDTFTINRNAFKFRATGQSCDILSSAFFRYQTIIFGFREEVLKFHPKFKAGSLTELDVNVKNKCDQYPYLGMDESCKFMHRQFIYYTLSQVSVSNSFYVISR